MKNGRNECCRFYCYLLSLIVFIEITAFQPVLAVSQQKQSDAEISLLTRKVKAFHVIPLRVKPGNVILKPQQSLVVDMLRGVELDDTPPKLLKIAKDYGDQGDGCAPGTAPYIAKDILPFRLRYFTNEFNYGGWHNYDMHDYVSAHGYSVIYPYVRDLKDNASHFPADTEFLRWGGYDWGKYLNEHGNDPERLDKLAEINPVNDLVKAGVYKQEKPYSVLMVDIETYDMPPDVLRTKPWYPAQASPEEKAAFEKKYYEGYAIHYAAIAQAARQQGGWKSIGIYGWQPFSKCWFGLENANINPSDYRPWNVFGKMINDAYDIIYPDLYVYYPSPQNVASTLANIDLCMKIERTASKPKPIRPYYWPLLHGGDADPHWWSNQPLMNEEMLAMIAMAYFTGIDGTVIWNWSEFDNHNKPFPLTAKAVGKSIMAGEAFTAKSFNGYSMEVHRYDVVYISNVDDVSGNVQFQYIEAPNAANTYAFRDYKYDATKPTYTMQRVELTKHLRSSSDPVSAAVEGLALVKPFEYILKHGEVKLDVSSQEQFANKLPIVRRVKLGKAHVLITYDPCAIYGAKKRDITLTDFDGHKGLTLTIPADDQTRIFVLKEN